MFIYIYINIRHMGHMGCNMKDRVCTVYTVHLNKNAARKVAFGGNWVKFPISLDGLSQSCTAFETLSCKAHAAHEEMLLGGEIGERLWRFSKCAPAVVSTLKGSLWKNCFFFSASWDMRVLRPALYRAYGSRLGHSGSTCGAWTGRIHRSTL